MYMYDFRQLIAMYGSPELYHIEKGEGYYDSLNHWHEGEEELKPIVGAVTNLSTDDLSFQGGGTLNLDDRKLYCNVSLEKGDQVKHKEKVYTILHDMDYTEHDEGLHIYYMKRGGRD